MSMTSFRNSEEPWDNYVTGDGKLEPATGIVLANSHKAINAFAKSTYQRRVFYSRYFCENADPIWETSRRGMLFL